MNQFLLLRSKFTFRFLMLVVCASLVIPFCSLPSQKTEAATASAVGYKTLPYSNLPDLDEAISLENVESIAPAMTSSTYSEVSSYAAITPQRQPDQTGSSLTGQSGLSILTPPSDFDNVAKPTLASFDLPTAPGISRAPMVQICLSAGEPMAIFRWLPIMWAIAGLRLRSFVLPMAPGLSMVHL